MERDDPPEWMEGLAPYPARYTHPAGWELTGDGERRDLYYRRCYDLVTPAEGGEDGGVVVIDGYEEECRWCQNGLVTLFEVDLRDPRMGFLGMEGERLRIVFCPNCSLQDAQVFMEVDGYGRSTWSAVNGERPAEGVEYGGAYVPVFPRRTLVLGGERRTPYEDGGSHIGGVPAWVQYDDYPRCLRCGRRMRFVGQFEPMGVEYVEGIVYAFLCVECGLATTGYQQT